MCHLDDVKVLTLTLLLRTVLLMIVVMVIIVLSDKDELGTDVHGRLVCYVAVTTIMVETVEHAVQTKTVLFRRQQSNDVTAEVVVADCRQ